MALAVVALGVTIPRHLFAKAPFTEPTHSAGFGDRCDAIQVEENGADLFLATVGLD